MFSKILCGFREVAMQNPKYSTYDVGTLKLGGTSNIYPFLF